MAPDLNDRISFLHDAIRVLGISPTDTWINKTFGRHELSGKLLTYISLGDSSVLGVFEVRKRYYSRNTWVDSVIELGVTFNPAN